MGLTGKHAHILRAIFLIVPMATFLASATLFSLPLAAQTTYFQLEIGAGAANETLPQFARRTNTQLIFSLEQLQGKQTNAIRGRFSIRSALRELLRGSGLTASYDANDVIVIQAELVPPVVVTAPIQAISQNLKANLLANRKTPIEEISVTARKWSEPLRDVPFSVAASTDADLFLSAAKDINDIARTVTGLTITDLGAGQSQLAIRGVSSGQVVRDQPGIKEQVGVYLDESAISTALFTPDLDLFDMKRFEVLRGPQGTLFGSGSLAGTLRYITNAPHTESLELFGELDTSMNAANGTGLSTKAGLNLPIVPDKAAIRLVTYFNDLAGYVDALYPDGAIRENVNNGTKFGGRISVLLKPAEQLTITPRLVYQSLETNGFPREDIFNVLANPYTETRPSVSLEDRQQFIQLREGLEDDFLLFDTVLSYELEKHLITSVSTYIDRQVAVMRDSGQLTMSILAQPSGFNLSGDLLERDAPLLDETDLSVFSQELRIASNQAGNAFQYVFGAFYTDSARDFGQTLVLDEFESLTGLETNYYTDLDDLLFYSRFRFDFQQVAVFGEASYKLSDKWQITGGLRWFDYKEERTLSLDGLFAASDIQGQDARTVSNGFTPRFILSFKPRKDLQINAQVAKGFRLGGINDPLNEPLCTAEDFETFGDRPFFENEELWNYELGFKSTLADGKLTFDVAAFYADINNLQATVDAGSCSSRIIFNIPEARSIGLEAEVYIQPSADFDISLSATMQNAEIRTTLLSETNVLDGISKGNRLPTSPTFQANAQFSYHFQLPNDWLGFASLSLSYAGKTYTQIGDQVAGFGTVDLTVANLGNPGVSQFSFSPQLPAYQTGNLRFGFRRGKWEASLYVSNIWNEKIRTSLDRERGGIARIGYLLGRPRTVGLTLRTQL